MASRDMEWRGAAWRSRVGLLNAGLLPGRTLEQAVKGLLIPHHITPLMDTGNGNHRTIAWQR